MRSPMPLLSLLALTLVVPTQADAARHRHHARRPPPPAVRVVVKPAPKRPANRQCPGAGTVWIASHPGPGGAWVSGHCERVGSAPRDGWVYVSGHWNGRVWVTGFWRPSVRVGFLWVEAHVADDEAYVAGYWEPEGVEPEGMMWRPGYFDGNDWVAGGWVPTETYTAYDEDGELAFFAVGDGHVEELAIPAAGIGDVDVGSTDPGDLSAQDALMEGSSGDVEQEADVVQERHAAAPE